jgi:pyruvate formate lyase activating enzyme
LEYYPERCIGCGRCFAICPAGAHKLDERNCHIVDRDLCANCLRCADTCFAEALTGVGQPITADELVEAVMTDMPYYERSGGGVTFTGGECMIQHDFLLEVLQKLKAKNIHTAVDTAGNVPWEWFESILPVTDLFLYDIKAADPLVHKRWTGVSNQQILENLHNLAQQGQRIWIRIPFIPGCNDREISAIADLIAPLSVERVDIMPYHKLGEGKYAALGIQNEDSICAIPTEAEIQNTLDLFTNKNIPAFRS